MPKQMPAVRVKHIGQQPTPLIRAILSIVAFHLLNPWNTGAPPVNDISHSLIHPTHGMMTVVLTMPLSEKDSLAPEGIRESLIYLLLTTQQGISGIRCLAI